MEGTSPSRTSLLPPQRPRCFEKCNGYTRGGHFIIFIISFISLSFLIFQSCKTPCKWLPKAVPLSSFPDFRDNFYCMVPDLGRQILVFRLHSRGACNKTSLNKGCITHRGLAIYIKKYLSANEELRKFKYFTMQKIYSSKKILQKKLKSFKIF